MSADNWTKCPKCTLDGLKKKQQEIASVAESYGKIHPSEYEKRLIKSREPIDNRETLRENYGFHLDIDGLFSVSYLGRCEKCGFKHEFKHSKQLEYNQALDAEPEKASARSV